MQIIQLPLGADGVLYHRPTEVAYDPDSHLDHKTWTARAWCDITARDQVGRAFCDQQRVFGLPHGEVLELGTSFTLRAGNKKTVIKDYAVVLVSGTVISAKSGHQRLVLCDSADQAFRLATAIQNGDPRARAYLPGGQALAPDLELPRVVATTPNLVDFPPVDRLRTAGGQRIEPLLWGYPFVRDSDLKPCPPRLLVDDGYRGCISEAQVRAVYARGKAAGLTRDELQELCRRSLRVPEVAQIRTGDMRIMMDEILPRAAVPGAKLNVYAEISPYVKFWRAQERSERNAARVADLRAAGGAR